jgi:hypothetical protein
VAYQRITLDEETKDDTTIKGEVKQVKEEGESIETIEKGKQIPTNEPIGGNLGSQTGPGSLKRSISPQLVIRTIS